MQSEDLNAKEYVGRSPEQVDEFVEEVVKPVRRKYRKSLKPGDIVKIGFSKPGAGERFWTVVLDSWNDQGIQRYKVRIDNDQIKRKSYKAQFRLCKLQICIVISCDFRFLVIKRFRSRN